MGCCGCAARLTLIATLFSYSLDSWISSALPRVVSGFALPGVLLPRRQSADAHFHACNDRAWVAGGAHPAAAATAARAAGQSEQTSSLGSSPAVADASAADDVTANSVASTCWRDGAPLSAKEAVESAASRLVPLFSEVDAHTQR